MKETANLGSPAAAALAVQATGRWYALIRALSSPVDAFFRFTLLF